MKEEEKERKEEEQEEARGEGIKDEGSHRVAVQDCPIRLEFSPFIHETE